MWSSCPHIILILSSYDPHVILILSSFYPHRYEPDDSDVMFINNGVEDVLEGGSKAIDRDELYMETQNFKQFRYTVISGPQHGQLHMIDPTSGQREQVRA